MFTNLFRRLFCGLILAFLLTSILPASAGATVVPIYSRTELGGDAYLDWGDLGPASDDYLDAPFELNSHGVSVAAIIPFGSYQRLDQGGWQGNFAPGEELLRNTDRYTPLTIDFSNPVAGLVAQIQGQSYGPFYGFLSATDSSGANIYDGSFAGQSTSAGDGSAVIFGILSDLTNIKRISLNVTSQSGNLQSFAINRIDLQTTTGSPVPVPPAFWLLGSGLLALVGLRVKKP